MKKKIVKVLAMVLTGAMLVSAVPAEMVWSAETSGIMQEDSEPDETESDGNQKISGQEIQEGDQKISGQEIQEGDQEASDQKIPEEAQGNQEASDQKIPEEAQEKQETSEPEIQKDEETIVQESAENNASSEVNEIDSENSAQEDLLNYLVVDKPYLESGDTQNIVLSIGTGEETIDSAMLKYHRESDGNTYEVSAAQIAGDGLRFEIPYSDSADTGVYILDAVSYIKNGEEYTIILSDTGIDARYGVNTEAETNPDAEVVDEEAEYNLDVSVSSFDEDGNQVSENSIEDAILSQQAQIPSVMSGNSTASGNVVVVLDPGHDSTHAGARANGLKEEELTLKIAQYCKAELETYSGVTVYMTRNTTSCPYPGTSSTEDNKKRVEYAASVGADVYVSIHLNSALANSANGAEVYYPNSNYNPSVGSQGYALASSVLSQLEALGLNNRGTIIRNSEDNTLYPDGSLADYYGVIKNSKLSGFPGIIIEHAFLTNSSDAAYLSSETNLKKLGIADATGIANYYSLSKDTDYPEGSAKVTAAANSTGTQYTLTASGVPKAYSLKFGVWSTENGQDDLIWYTAAKDSSGNWKATAKISNHKTAGSYNVHAYITRSNGTSYYAGATTFSVSTAAMTGITAKNINADAGTFDVILSGISSKSGISTAQVAVWSKSNQSDLKWYTASKQSDGTYKASVNIANHNYNYGTYQLHAYLTDGNGICVFGKATTATIKQSSASTTLAAAVDSTGTKSNITLKNVASNLSVSKIRFAVWSSTNGQDDLKWYTATKSGTTWSYSVPLSNHKTAGTYYVHAYADLTTGKSVMLASTTFNVSAPTLKTVTATGKDTTAGTFSVVAGGVSSTAGLSKVQIAVWSQSNQSDLKWYTASKQSDGTYKVNVDIANHNYNYGTYQAHVYLTDKNGIFVFGGGTSVSFARPASKLSAAMSADGAKEKISISNVPYGSGVSKLRFAVWSSQGGQDDLKWYTAEKSGTTWSYSVSLSNHKTAGTYYVHAYADLKNGKSVMLASTTFNVSAPTLKTVTATSKDTTAGTFSIVVGGVSSTVGISKMQIAVWSQSNQSDLKWYTASKQSDGTYKVNADISNHNYNYGTYQAHVYMTDKNGIFAFGGAASIAFARPAAKLSAALDSTGTKANLSISNVAYGSGLSKVKFAVWSAANGQDDLKWYTASKSNAAWSYSVPISNHKTAGVYYVHAYADLKNGSMMMLASTTFTVKAPSATAVSVVNKNESAGTFQVKSSGVTSGAAIKKVQVAVWSQGNQSDIVWYTATKTGNNEYTVYVDIKNHGNNLGKYYAHVYAEDALGLKVNVGQVATQITKANNSYYNIMGSSSVTAAQLASYYKANAVYPSYYASTDAATLTVFCQMYIDECNAEGVKAEVAFCQAMKETGFLKYGGDVQIEQFNFAGLGATGNGEPGLSFSSVRIGIRAHVQHLKAYASTESLRQTCVDPRFSYVSRGCAPYVEWLGVNENPKGKGWATSKNYGYSLRDEYIANLLQY